RRRGHFNPLYGEVDQSFLYAGTEQLCLVPLRADQASPFAPKSDEEGAAEENKDKDKEKDKQKDKDKAEKGKDEKKGEDKVTDDKKADDEEEKKPVEIALDGFEQRAVLLPIDAGVFGSFAVNDDGALLYGRRPIQGEDDDPAIHLFDVGAEPKERE